VAERERKTERPGGAFRGVAERVQEAERPREVERVRKAERPGGSSREVAEPSGRRNR